jgi:tripartite-type tricarboxylate transporter receptor subunit TctC
MGGAGEDRRRQGGKLTTARKRRENRKHEDDMITRRFLLSAAVAAGWIAAAGAGSAQTYPDKPIKIIVAVSPGGPMDTMARFTAQQMQATLGQPVVVENRPGAGGTIGAKSVATAEPDGYTFLWGTLQTVAIAPTLYKKLDYDPAAFVPVGLVAYFPHVFVVPVQVPAKTVREFVAFAKSSTEKLNFGGSLATPPQLMGALFNKINGLDIVYVPYKGAAPSLADLMSARTHMAFDGLVTLHPLIREGKLRALAVTDAKRSPVLPDVPTMIESGYPDFPQNPWAGILAPAGTPSHVVAKVNDAINAAIKSDEVRAHLAKLSLVPAGGSPQDFAGLIKRDGPRWAEIVKLSGASVQ